MPLEELCLRCFERMPNEELKSWNTIKRILGNHPRRTFDEGVNMNFTKRPCDFQEIIKKKIPINCEEMQYTNDQSDNDEEDEEEEKTLSNSSGAKQA